MILPDVNVLVYAHRRDTPDHEAYRSWLESVPDAYYAALAIEHGCEWITTDRDFSRFTGLKWRHPMS